MLTSVDDPGYWDNLYEKGEAGWDLKTPNPVFISLLDQKIISTPCKLLVTGSGKGYDAVAAAKAGFDVTAVDFSANAVKHTRELAEKENVVLKVLEADVFKLKDIINSQFDAVYEYTTFCAINPARRNEFAQEISAFIKPGGKFIALVFPIDGRGGGPPFNIDIVEFYLMFSKYLNLEFSTRFINSVKPRKNKEILQVYIKTEEKRVRE